MASKSESGKVHPIFWCIFVISILFGIAGIVLIAYSVITIGLASGRNGNGHGLDTSCQRRTTKKTPAQPTILFIMMDDLGFNDVSWNNPDVRMPNMGKLAREGVVLDRNYAHTVCTPSRAEFLTGKYAHRMGVQHRVFNHGRPDILPLEEKTLADGLKEAGYSTHLLGKWHLGSCRRAAAPLGRGFDTFNGALGGYVDSWSRCSQSAGNDPAFDWWENEFVDMGGLGVHVTDIMKERAIKIIKESDGTKPLFLFMSFFAPHVPIQTYPKYTEPYRNLNDNWRQEYLGMVTHVDEAVGELIQSLKDKGLYENTVIGFSSDNGGDPGPSSNYPLRAAKLSTFEGGIRVPGFFSGPGLKKKGYYNTERFHMTDWLPTFMEIAGSSNYSKDINGVNQRSMLYDGGPSKHREIVHRIDTYPPVSYGYAALSYGEYKLILGSPGYSDGWQQDKSVGLRVGDNSVVPVFRFLRWAPDRSDKCPFTRILPYNFTLLGISSKYGRTLTDRTELYNVYDDPEERNNLASQMPEKVDELRARLQKHLDEEVFAPEEKYYDLDVSQRDHVWRADWCENL